MFMALNEIIMDVAKLSLWREHLLAYWLAKCHYGNFIGNFNIASPSTLCGYATVHIISAVINYSPKVTSYVCMYVCMYEHYASVSGQELHKNSSLQCHVQNASHLPLQTLRAVQYLLRRHSVVIMNHELTNAATQTTTTTTTTTYGVKNFPPNWDFIQYRSLHNITLLHVNIQCFS
jgi:hypothetical protein